MTASSHFVVAVLNGRNAGNLMGKSDEVKMERVTDVTKSDEM